MLTNKMIPRRKYMKANTWKLVSHMEVLMAGRGVMDRLCWISMIKEKLMRMEYMKLEW